MTAAKGDFERGRRGLFAVGLADHCADGGASDGAHGAADHGASGGSGRGALGGVSAASGERQGGADGGDKDKGSLDRGGHGKLLRMGWQNNVPLMAQVPKGFESPKRLRFDSTAR
jgi:hypothetical protein